MMQTCNMSSHRSFVDWQTVAWLHSFLDFSLWSWQMWCWLLELEGQFPFLPGIPCSSPFPWTCGSLGLETKLVSIEFGVSLVPKLEIWCWSWMSHTILTAEQACDPHYLVGLHHASPMNCFHWIWPIKSIVAMWRVWQYLSLSNRWSQKIHHVWHDIVEILGPWICWAQDWCSKHAMGKDQHWHPI